MRKFLFVLNQPPHDGLSVQETLDVILTVAAFDQPVSLLLLDNGVFQIKQNQNPEQVALKDTSAVFKALEIYDVHNIYLEVESLQERGLKICDLILPVKEVYRKNIGSLMKLYQIVYGS
jgi:tRNA 2-thiouridine synthesizing protein C